MTANELKALREGLGWTQHVAAQNLGVNLRTYKYYEQGKTSAGSQLERIPRAVALAALSLRFQIDVARVIAESGE